MFGGSPNPNGSVTVDVPVATEAAPDRAESVVNHPRPDYDPLPLRAGAFLVAPTLETGSAYNSNIYATPRATADAVIFVHPAVTAQSDWNRHMLAVTAEGDVNFFQNHPDQNLNTAILQVDGRYDLSPQTWAAGQAGYQMQDVPRSTLTNGVNAQPTVFNLYTAGVSAFRGVGLMHAQMDYSFNKFDYTQAPDGSQSYSVFNRNENQVSGRFAYAANDDFKPYVSGQVNSRTYATTSARNSQGYHADAGLAWDIGGITSLDVHMGWLAQDYSSFGAEPVNQGIDFGGNLLWNVTPLTSVTLSGNRSVEEANITGYNSFLATGVSAVVSHELRRNILLEGDLSYANNEYRGFSQRQDDVASAGSGVRYFINRNLYTDLDYSWSHRSSSVESQGYIDHLIVAKLGIRL